MRVRVLFFGLLKDLVGRQSELLELSDEATAADVLAHYEKQSAKLREFSSSIAMSLNQEYCAPNARLQEGDEIAFLPPVSGGASRSQHCAILREKIDTRLVLEQTKRAEDGAAVVFEGVVRNHTRGRRTLYLDYEAYEEMALKQMEGLAEEALSRFKVRDVALVHRLGRLEIGETSVLIVVASAHRAPAFDACRWLIDTLKRTVPIWKKEYFEDGAVWAEGEPFPLEIKKGQEISEGQPASKLNSPR